MLACSDLTIAHGDITAVSGVNLEVAAGETVALIGANGAGKTTLLHAISGLNRVRRGDIAFDGASILKMSTDRRVAIGIAQAPEGRRIFAGLTVEENLTIATTNWRGWRNSCSDDLDRVFQLFPRLKERRCQLGWSLSGGEQQMLAIGRALMARPRLLLLDEPSLGLAPRLAEEVYERVKLIASAGLTILVVEQNTVLALSVADRAYVLNHGRVVLDVEAVLHGVQAVFEVALGEFHHDAGVHLNEAAVGIVGEALVVDAGGEALDRFVIEAEVEDCLHHAWHGAGRARADADEERVFGIAKLLLGDLFELGYIFGDLFFELGGILLSVLVEVIASFG